MICFRFLLSYEKYLKNLGPDYVDEMDEKNEKIFEEEEKKTPNGTNGENGEGGLEDEDEVIKAAPFSKRRQKKKLDLANVNISGGKC